MLPKTNRQGWSHQVLVVLNGRWALGAYYEPSESWVVNGSAVLIEHWQELPELP